MDEQRAAEARSMVRQVALELEQAAAAARLAADAGTDNRGEAWKQLQMLYTRFDQAAQLLRDVRRAVDAAMKPD